MHPSIQKAGFASLPDSTRHAAVVRVLAALRATPFAQPRRWPTCVVVLRDEGDSVTDRGSFAGWLASNDMPALARECRVRSIAPGSVLVWLEVDRLDVSGATFVVVDLAAERRRLLGAS